MYCSQCGTEVWRSDNFCRACGTALAVTATYFPVTRRKFIFMNLITWNLYTLYWFWKNWRYVKDRDSSSILPWARALFAPLWYYALLAAIRRHHFRGPSRLSSFFLGAVPYFLTLFLANLPDPYWLLSLLAFVPLLPAVSQINHLNRKSSWLLQRNSQYRAWQLAVTPLSVALLLFTFAYASSFIPGVDPVAGSRLWKKDVRFIESLGLLDDGEPILVYYSHDPFSFRGDGNIVTDRQLISYATDETGETEFWNARYDEIVSVHVFYTESFWDDTEIVVCVDDDWLLLFAGDKGPGRNPLVQEIEKHVDKDSLFVHPWDDDVDCEDYSSS